jgi:hypothetical protein
MSGPIIRKYGFPNFDKIFGERPLEHGLEDDEAIDPQADSADAVEAPKKTATKKKAKPSKKE